MNKKTQAIDLLDRAPIQRCLASRAASLFNTIDIFDVLDSTNTYLLEKQPCAFTEVCLAERQTAGRGRRGRSWYSSGGGLHLSVLWHFDGLLALLDGLSLMVGIAVVKALQTMGVTGIGIKWPNDIYYNDQKLGGILLEMIRMAEGPCKVVIGIGINVCLPDQSKQHITQPYIDLTSIMNRNISRNEIVGLILNELAELLTHFQQRGFKYYEQEWQKLDLLQGKQVNVHTATAAYTGRVLGINEVGNLRVNCEDGIERCFNSADVSIRLDGKEYV